MRCHSLSFPARAFVLAALGVAGLVAAFLLDRTGRKTQETVGFAEFRLPSTPGHPPGPTVRFNLPAEFRVRYHREHRNSEAGVEDARGNRVCYVTVRLAAILRVAEGETPLQSFARQNDLAGDADCLDILAEFRTTNRGPIWCQRYTQVFRKRDPNRPAQNADPDGQPERLDVIRYAEQWQGLILELEFHTRPGRRAELEPLLWNAVREMQLTARPEP